MMSKSTKLIDSDIKMAVSKPYKYGFSTKLDIDTIEKGLNEERKSFYNLLNSENTKEGISSFLNKKKPNWKD